MRKFFSYFSGSGMNTNNDKSDQIPTPVKGDPHGEMRINPELSLECMQLNMSYYITLSKIIDRKFGHARKAINKRLSELETEQARSQTKDAPVDLSKMRKYKALGDVLTKLSGILESTQLGIDDLEQMNEVFGLLPGKIKVYYEHLVSVDAELVEMIKEISSEEYQAAYKRAQKIIDMVQEGKDVLSGHEVPDQTLHYNVKDILQPLRTELSNMVATTKDGYTVLPDGSLVKEL